METLWKQVDALVEESGVQRYLEEIPGDLGSQSEEALTEWRSSEQVENGNPSTSISYWDTDDDLEGTKPSELFGKHTWRVENFSQINKRELRGDVFEAGGHKWYILIYPQGCDVVNHVSLFLCVADHDKLLPGWGHFAQFTIAVVNKDPKKSKYSDTLHRFWKKEHDWGWKKFMEISKVLDGFLDDDTFIIKAQVQVIREKVDRPFRCLDRQYRRELVRVYLSNVEQICRKFVEEKRSKLKELIDDKARWSSFSTFWLGMDQNVRRFMSQEKSDVIFKLIVKHFFIEKEVTSTLVMDSLYSGLKALEILSSCIKGRVKLLETAEIPAPIVHIDSEMFVVVDDVLSLLERAAMEPLPPKDEKGPQNRMKDGGSGEDFNKDSIERDERRLTEMGRRTFESFVLSHIFCKIEVAHQEVVALKRQEELIREEEEAGIAESEQKAKRRATEKEKKLKKKLAKQKRNNRQGKDRGRDGKPHTAVQVKQDLEILNDEMKDLVMECGHPVCEKSELLEDVSDPSDSNDCVAGSYQEEFEERDPSPVNWDTDASEVHAPADASDSGTIGLSCVQNGFVEKKSLSVMDDSSSTCSTDSVPSAVASGPSKGNFSSNHKASNRVKNRRGTVTYEGSHLAKDTDDQPSCPSVSLKAAEYEAETALSSHYQIKKHEEPSVKKDVECFPVQGRRIIKQHGVGRSFKDKPATAPSPSSPPWNPPSHIQQRPEPKKPVLDPPVKKPFVKSAPSTTQISLKQHETPKAAAPSKLTEMPSGVSRPASAPLVPTTRPPPPPAVSVVQKTPLLARSVSAASRLGPDPSLPTHSHGPPQSYRNAIISNPAGPSTSSSAKPLPSPPYSQAPPMLPRMEPDPVKPAISFGDRSLDFDTSSEPVAGVSGRQAQGVLADEFPHLDIINDLLEDEHGTGNVQSLGSNNLQLLGQRYSFAGESSSGKSHRTVGYRGNNGFLQQPYGCLGNQHVKSFRDYVPQGNAALLPYLNGQVDGLMQNQWQPGGSDVSLHGMGGGMDGGDTLPYRIMEYPQFRSSNGH